jgi:hypothetical protein
MQQFCDIALEGVPKEFRERVLRQLHELAQSHADENAGRPTRKPPTLENTDEAA